MPSQLTYPGVYVEEIPSGVRTITGASTSVALFVGYTPRGPLDKPVRIFNFGEYERTFGALDSTSDPSAPAYRGLDPSSDLSYAVYHYFLNGGTDAYVIRVAAGAVKAGISVDTGPCTFPGAFSGSPAGLPVPVSAVLAVTAVNAGVEGNRIALTVTHAANQGSNDLFSLEVDAQDGSLPETFPGLSMDPLHPSFAVPIINGRSHRIRVAPFSGLDSAIGTVRGRCIGDVLTLSDLNALLVTPTVPHRFLFSYNGAPYIEVSMPTLTAPGGTFSSIAAQVQAYGDYLAAQIEGAVHGLGGTYSGFVCQWEPPATGDYSDLTADVAAYGRLITRSGVERSTTAGITSAVSFMSAGDSSFAAATKLTRAAGAREYSGVSAVRPAQNGTETGDLWQAIRILSDLGGNVGLEIQANGLPPPATPVTYFVPIIGTSLGAMPSSLSALRARIEAQLRTVNAEYLRAATVNLEDGRFLIRASGSNPNIVLMILSARDAPTGTMLPRAVRALGIDTTLLKQQTTRSLLGQGAAIAYQRSLVLGVDGGRAVGTSDYVGVEASKTGMYAAADVDAFNLLCFPGETRAAVLGPAAAYCERRRAMLIVDPPEVFTTSAPGASTVDAVRGWLSDSGPMIPPLSKNVAVYFPRLMAPDPVQNGAVRAFPPCGAIAGVIARTDTERGIWKAPAGVDASLKGATGLKYRLTEQEVGALNPLGLNCLREMPLYGQVVWGTRTRMGADGMTSEWKYLPVRRLALHIEESLYRGTQWAVFEPNDEPLWAQLRLNVGAFMNSLFRQGAFQGRTSREAYFVKCDSETNTQGDINVGRVNIVVGFAPLKPAEFVVIKLQQIAGQIPT